MKNSNQLFFPYCPELPKRPKQNNLCIKMWLIYQLCIELGIKPSYIFQILQNLVFLDKEEILPFDDLINRQLSDKNLRKKQTDLLRIRM